MSPVVHFEMPAKDKARASKFYESAFGWGMTMAGANMGDYLMATTTETGENGRPTNPGAINGGFFDYKAGTPGFDSPHLVISVENIKESMEMVKNAGGKILGEPMDIPTVGIYVSVEDTEGNIVGMLQPSPLM